jgi:hypothetical protein
MGAVVMSREEAMQKWVSTFGAPFEKHHPCPAEIVEEVSRRSGLSAERVAAGLIKGTEWLDVQRALEEMGWQSYKLA